MLHCNHAFVLYIWHTMSFCLFLYSVSLYPLFYFEFLRMLFCVCFSNGFIFNGFSGYNRLEEHYSFSSCLQHYCRLKLWIRKILQTSTTKFGTHANNCTLHRSGDNVRKILGAIGQMGAKWRSQASIDRDF